MQKVMLIAATGVVCALGCGPSAGEVRRAQMAYYTCDYEQVFHGVVEVVKAAQPPVAVADLDGALVVSDFRWHDQHGARKRAGSAVVGEGDVAFSVALTIESADNGYHVRAAPRVLAQQPDSPHGFELTRDHANWPHWADAKADKVLIEVRKRLGSCAVDPDAQATGVPARNS
jgi:hypothetical protein